MPTNDTAAPTHVCPGIGIHAIDMVQPPGIGISPMADMEPHQTVVSVALTTKSSAEVPKNACCEVLSKVMGHYLLFRNWLLTMAGRSSLAVLVVSLPPETILVSPLRGTVEPWVHAPEAVEPSRIGGIRVVDHAVFEGERAHARSLANVRRRVRSAHSRERLRPIGRRARDLGPFLSECSQWCLGPIVVFDATLALLLLRVRSAEVK